METVMLLMKWWAIGWGILFFGAFFLGSASNLYFTKKLFDGEVVPTKACDNVIWLSERRLKLFSKKLVFSMILFAIPFGIWAGVAVYFSAITAMYAFQQSAKPMADRLRLNGYKYQEKEHGSIDA